MTILTKKLSEPPIVKKEILRYALCREATPKIDELLDSCIAEAKDALTYAVCYTELEVKVTGEVCDFGVFCVASADLAKSLEGSEKVILFAATVGVSLDRLIRKYSKISPSRAVMLQAFGTERIEALCNAFCCEMGTPARFSPGYGDLPLEVQKDIFDVLSCTKNIGVSLSDSLLMSPSKSVTAFAFSKEQTQNKCKLCDKLNCSYRGAL